MTNVSPPRAVFWRVLIGSTLVGVFLLAGCAAPRTEIASRSDVATADPTQRLMVISQVAWADPTWAKPFEAAMLTELRRYRLSAWVQTRDPVAVHSDKVRYARELSEHKPDAVLVVEPGDGAADAYGRQLRRRLELGLFRNYTDRQQRELIWRASVMLEPAGYFIGAADMTALAHDIVARLVSDQILAKPPAPKQHPGRPISAW